MLKDYEGKWDGFAYVRYPDVPPSKTPIMGGLGHAVDKINDVREKSGLPPLTNEEIKSLRQEGFLRNKEKVEKIGSIEGAMEERVRKIVEKVGPRPSLLSPEREAWEKRVAIFNFEQEVNDYVKAGRRFFPEKKVRWNETQSNKVSSTADEAADGARALTKSLDEMAKPIVVSGAAALAALEALRNKKNEIAFEEATQSIDMPVHMSERFSPNSVSRFAGSELISNFGKGALGLSGGLAAYVAAEKRAEKFANMAAVAGMQERSPEQSMAVAGQLMTDPSFYKDTGSEMFETLTGFNNRYRLTEERYKRAGMREGPMRDFLVGTAAAAGVPLDALTFGGWDTWTYGREGSPTTAAAIDSMLRVFSSAEDSKNKKE
jgi:hypothetical protein